MKPRIVFMGTPEFAVASLRALVEEGNEVVGVVTTPDKPVGRHGSRLQPSPVKCFALEQGLPVLQPEKLRDPAFLQALSAWRADLQVVVAFRMLPEVVWAMPPLGTFNLHASLLPQYRGAAPINWAIINGETRTGVTTFLLDQQIDTGRILLQESTPIAPDDTAGTLHDRLMQMGAALVCRTVDLLRAGRATPVEQKPVGELRAAPKLFRDTCRIDWSQSAEQVRNFIRGLSPYPGAWTELGEGQLKVYESCLVDGGEGDIGQLAVREGQLLARCADGWLRLTQVQASGKRRMDDATFVRGWRGR